MNTRKPTGNAMPDNHPPFGEVRRIECRDGHVAGTWWRPSSGQPFEAVDEPAAGVDVGVDVGSSCPTCGRELGEVHALIDPAPGYHIETGQEEL